MDEDWDTLVVLDACRADLFEEVVDTSRFDDYRRVKSLGSGTGEWTERNFTDDRFGDTVYVASNPHTSRIAGDRFYDLTEVWRESFSDEHRTVPPEAVTEAALRTYGDHPDKRLIVHYMQPHHPFITRPDLQFGHENEQFGGTRTADVERPRHVWDALEMGRISRAEAWAAYGENLNAVMDHALRVADEVPGRTVITSDHGNLLGERVFPLPVRMYSHANGVRHPALVDVPWAVLDGERREVVAGEAASVSTSDEQSIKRRLRQLGYAE
jgi:hypothetical protein